MNINVEQNPRSGFFVSDEAELARLSNHDRVQRIASYSLDKFGETRHDLHRLNLRGLFSFASVIHDGRGGLDHNSRQFRADEVKARRAARRLMASLGFGPSHTGCGRDCTGRWFCNYAELMHVDTTYQYAIVKTSHSIDI